MTPRAFSAAVRSALARRDAKGLARAARAAGPETLAAAWPKIPLVGRVAALRALDAAGAARTFAALPSSGRWLAYLAAFSDGAAPLFEGAPKSARRGYRPLSARERAAMRKALTR